LSALSQLSAQAFCTGAGTAHLLVVGSTDRWPGALHQLTHHPGIELTQTDTCREARDPALLSNVDAVVLCGPIPEDLPGIVDTEVQLLSDALNSHRLKCIVLAPGTSGGVPGLDDAFVSVPDDVSVEELWGRVATMNHYGPMLQRMEEQVSTMQRLGKRLNQQFVEVDQELRLATRLQRDFLPKAFPDLGDMRFAALYRPANWVSGDVYDVSRLDETHLSFYVADAVGHGVAASLLTMFIKQSVVGKRVEGDNYEILSAGDVLAQLNVDLAKQELPHCQFVTACYGIIDTQTHELTFARGGHPHPIHVNEAGRCSEVHTVGGLLGVFPEEVFPSTRLVLEPGEKLVIYSDGVEDDIVEQRDRDSVEVCFSPHFQEFVRLPADACINALRNRLDHAEGSLAPPDDVTVLIIERLRG